MGVDDQAQSQHSHNKVIGISTNAGYRISCRFFFGKCKSPERFFAHLGLYKVIG